MQGAPRRRIRSPWAKVWTQYTYRVFLHRLGADLGGEGPRAEGVGGGKPPPFQKVLTRPTEGRRILSAQKAPAGRLSGQTYNSLRSAHARRPAYTFLRLRLLLHHNLKTQSVIPTSRGTPPPPPIGPRALWRDPRGPWDPFGGYSEAIPNGRSFRKGSYFEWVHSFGFPRS